MTVQQINEIDKIKQMNVLYEYDCAAEHTLLLDWSRHHCALRWEGGGGAAAFRSTPFSHSRVVWQG